jgi:hypothetical protein
MFGRLQFYLSASDNLSFNWRIFKKFKIWNIYKIYQEISVSIKIWQEKICFNVCTFVIPSRCVPSVMKMFQTNIGVKIKTLLFYSTMISRYSISYWYNVKSVLEPESSHMKIYSYVGNMEFGCRNNLGRNRDTHKYTPHSRTHTHTHLHTLILIVHFRIMSSDHLNYSKATLTNRKMRNDDISVTRPIFAKLYV